MRREDLSREQIRGLGRCLVTGGGGFLGRHLVRQLLGLGAQVRILGRRRYPELEAAGAECVQGDLAEDGVAAAACRGVRTVFHAASSCSLGGPRREIRRVNVAGTRLVLRACLQDGCRRLVYTSSPSVVIGPEDIVRGDEALPYLDRYLADYPRTKMEAERMILAADGQATAPDGGGGAQPGGAPGAGRLRTCALRPHLIWGADDPHILPRIRRSAAAGRLCQIGDGRNEVTITHVENAAWAHVLAAVELCGAGRCAGRAYFIGDEPPVLLWPWIRRVLQETGVRPLRRLRLHPLVASLAARIVEAAAWLLPRGRRPVFTRFVVQQLSRSHSLDLSAARRDLGYEMIVSPEEGLASLRGLGRPG